MRTPRPKEFLTDQHQDEAPMVVQLRVHLLQWLAKDNSWPSGSCKWKYRSRARRIESFGFQVLPDFVYADFAGNG